MEYEYTRVAPHNSFVADIEVTDVQSEIHITGRTQDLSLLGCGVNTSKPFPKGTRVRIKLSHGGADVAALAKVAYARPDLGMGVVFTSVEPEDERILGAWIAELLSISLAHA
jgi:CDGSH-type Zn-finger protein